MTHAISLHHRMCLMISALHVIQQNTVKAYPIISPTRRLIPRPCGRTMRRMWGTIWRGITILWLHGVDCIIIRGASPVCFCKNYSWGPIKWRPCGRESVMYWLSAGHVNCHVIQYKNAVLQWRVIYMYNHDMCMYIYACTLDSMSLGHLGLSLPNFIYIQNIFSCQIGTNWG